MTSAPAEHHTRIQGLSLHHLEWTSDGPPMVWLTGLGHSAHIFRGIASCFAPGFHVFALTRRGHGQSHFPADARFDPQVLAADLLGFLDHHDLKDVVLVGHSIAGNELTLVAGMQPERFRSLVYLDAAYDRSGVLDRMRMDPQMQQVSRRKQPGTVEGFREDLKGQYGFWNESLEHDLHDLLVLEEGRWRLKEVPDLLSSTDTHSPDYSGVRCPALSIHAMFPDSGKLDPAGDVLGPAGFWDSVMVPWQTHSIQQFETQCRLGQVLKWGKTGHHFFLSEQGRTVTAIQKFLDEL